MRQGRLFAIAQVLTSATNFSLTLLLARSYAPSAFGAGVAALTGAYFVVAMQRSVVGDSLIVCGQDEPALTKRAAPAIAVGLAVTASGAAVFALLGTDTTLAVTLGAATLIVIYQDGLRYAVVSRGNGTAVIAADLVWLTCAAAAVAALFAGSTPVDPALIWLFGGAIATIILQAEIGRPTLWGLRREIKFFFGVTGRLSGWLGLQFLLGTGLTQAVTFALIFVLGPIEFADLRITQILLGPMLTLITAVSSPVLLSMVTSERKPFLPAHRRRLAAVCLVTSAALIGLCVFAGQTVATWLFGSQYAEAGALTVYLMPGLLFVAATIVPGAVLRAAGAGREVLLGQAVGVVPGSVLILLLARNGGAAWALVGVSLQALGVLVGTAAFAARVKSAPNATAAEGPDPWHQV